MFGFFSVNNQPILDQLVWAEAEAEAEGLKFSGGSHG